MSEMDLHGDTEVGSAEEPGPEEIEDLDDVEVPEADAVEQAAPLTEQQADHEVVPLDEDEYR